MKKNLCNTKKNKIIAVVGATASGKTSYSVKLANEINGEIVSADSRYVYKYFDVAVAKPSVEERGGIQHYMIDVVEPDFDYSAGLYLKDAKICIEKILNKGKIPIVVGGTGLYFNMLFENYQLPKIKADYKLRTKLNAYDCKQLYELLLRLDGSVNNIEINDKKRLIRTIEILKLTGKKLSEVRFKGEKEYNVEWIGLNYERDELYKRINKRVDMMFENGIIDETKMLIEKYGRIHNIVDTIGYKEVIGYLDGEMTLENAKEKLKQNSRRYAKRQLTWFRRNPDIEWNIFPEKMLK